MKHIISKGVTLYTAGTPNGWKVSILLKELNYPMKVEHTKFPGFLEHKEDWFLDINPNGRIPAIVDHDNDDYAVFESGAILMYLAEKAGRFFPQQFNRRYEVMQWLMFQMGGVGPMFGQAGHFIRYAKVDIEYGKRRYFNETCRLISVLDRRLAGREYLAGDEESDDGYSIADMATIGWVLPCFGYGVDLNSYPNVQAWVKRIYDRPAVREGLDVPTEFPHKETVADPAKLAEAVEAGQGWMQRSDGAK